MEVFTTIITGVVVFILGQAFLKLVIEPVQRLKVTISDVAFCLMNDYIYYMNSDAVHESDASATYKKLRELGARLHGDISIVPWYSHFRKLFLLPKFDSVNGASDKLFAISNWLYSKRDDKYERMDLLRIEICRLLSIHIKEEEEYEEILKESIRAYAESRERV
jgi:hypothetical protein